LQNLVALHTQAMVKMVEAVARACDAVLPALDGTQAKTVVDNMIKSKVAPEIAAMATIKRKVAVLEMYKLNMPRGLWTEDG